MTRVGVAAALVDGELVDGDLEVVDGSVARVGLSPPGAGLAVPGWVDLHTNGIAGIDFASASVEDHMIAARHLARSGVLAYQPSVVSAPADDLCRALGVIAQAQAAGAAGARIVGAHVEGPFLAPGRAGAHPREALLAPDRAVLAQLLGAGPVSMLTLAPELPGALDLVEDLLSAGVVVSAGHSEADASEARAGFDRGIRAVTHVFNAMPPVSARRPGLAGAALARDGVALQLIVDRVHVADDLVRLAWRSGPERLVLVTDATTAAGLPDGSYRLGGRAIHREGEAVRLDDGTLAGSCLTMAQAVRNAVDCGIPLAAALNAASRNPARLLRRPDLGRLRVGATADLVVLDDDLSVRQVLVAGDPFDA